MAQCINCKKEYSCSCSMYKKKYCNPKCEEQFLKPKSQTNADSSTSGVQQLQQPKVTSGTN